MSDASARRQALDLSRSFVVRAPAGSGKTGLLIQRMLAALSQVDEPEQVLAITFTRKAAAEIRQRLLDALALAESELAPEEDFQKQTWLLARQVKQRDEQGQWNLAANPGRLRASTIDALNREYAARLPLLSGLGGVPEPQEHAESLYQQAVQRCFEKIEDPSLAPELHAALRKILALGQNRVEALSQTIGYMLSTREHWLPICWAEQDHAVTVKAALEQRSRIRLARAQSLLAHAPCAAWCANLAQVKDDAPSHWPDAELDQLSQWQYLADGLLTNDGTWRKPRGLNKNHGFEAKLPTTNTAKQLLEEFADCGEEAARALDQIRKLPSQFPIEMLDLAEALISVLLECCVELRLTFSAEQKADYAELALAALSALYDAESGVAEREDARLRHLLVDEMQDTSSAQVRLLERLVDGWGDDDEETQRSVFLVGDPQQSIYLFRQARVELFQNMLTHQQLGSVKLDALILERNFRSRAAIVDWVNQQVGGIFAGQTNSDIRYSASLATRDNLQNSGCQIHNCEDAEEEARQARELIQDFLQNEIGQIAVLARSRNHLLKLSEKLLQANIPYSAQDTDPLIQRPAIRNYLALVFSRHNPAHDLYFMRLLRSPGVGLSWAELDEIAQLEGENWQNKLAIADETKYPRAARLKQLWQQVEEHTELSCNLLAACDFLHAQLGMAAQLDTAERHDVLRLKQLLQAHIQGGQLVDEEGFIDSLNRLYASTTPSRVELMTVHKSKGLEFERVLLIGCGRRLRNSDDPLLRFSDRYKHLLLAPKPPGKLDETTDAGKLYKLLKSEAEAEEHAEAIRLLYVAATRAKDRLDILYTDNQKPHPRSFAGLLELEAQASEEAENEEASYLPVRHPRLPINAIQAPDTKLATRPILKQQNSPSRLIAQSRDHNSGPQWQRMEASLIGTLVHEGLEHLSRLAESDWPHALANMQRAAQAGLLRRGLSPGRSEQASQQVIQLLQQASQGTGRWLLEEKPWAASELALAAHQSGQWQSAIIDRCFEDEAGLLYVADYKSNQPPTEDLELWLQAQCEHYAPQTQAYAKLLARQRAYTAAPIQLLYFVACDQLMRRDDLGHWQSWLPEF